MHERSLEETVEKLDEAFNRGDLEAVLDFYEDGAVVVLEPGRTVQGKAGLREAFQAIFALDGVARQIKTAVIEAGDVALFISKWNFSGKTTDGTPFSRESIATSVFRKQADGRWRCVIDNPYGPVLLD
ncbi:MAG: SgcJ/EcaC family oxidoreductase [Acidobacteriota bacterium]|nr:SgcJ/EcaC family oxidoreductase [Acidobacteriota bacterium]